MEGLVPACGIDGLDRVEHLQGWHLHVRDGDSSEAVSSPLIQLYRLLILPLVEHAHARHYLSFELAKLAIVYSFLRLSIITRENMPVLY